MFGWVLTLLIWLLLLSVIVVMDTKPSVRFTETGLKERKCSESYLWTVALLRSQGRQPLIATKPLNIQHIEPWSRRTTAADDNIRYHRWETDISLQRVAEIRPETAGWMSLDRCWVSSHPKPNTVHCSAPDLKSIAHLQRVVKWEICTMDVQLTNLWLYDAVNSTWTTFFHHCFYATKI